MRIFAQGWSYRKDGPGHRKIYYLKGCNFSCLWCGSPESISPEDELLFYPQKLSGSDETAALCPGGRITGGGLDRTGCSGCQACRKFRHPALQWAGEELSISRIISDLSQAKKLWPDFAGVTFGGGEPTLQSRELAKVLAQLKEMKIHTAVESNAGTRTYRDIVPLPDLLISDLKAGSREVLKTYTGGDLDLVLDNLQFASYRAEQLLIRIPLITGINDSPDELTGMVRHLEKLHQLHLAQHHHPLECEILALHHFGECKYQALGKIYRLSGVPVPDTEKIDTFSRMLADTGIRLQHN